jgi:hypothetical protein
MGLGDSLQAAKHAGRCAAGASARRGARGRRDQIVINIRTTLLAVGAAALALAGCGERPQVIQYKQGTYQGKPDTPAYSNAPFNGNRAQWENEINSRNQNQNEYVRLRD